MFAIEPGYYVRASDISRVSVCRERILVTIDADRPREFTPRGDPYDLAQEIVARIDKNAFVELDRGTWVRCTAVNMIYCQGKNVFVRTGEVTREFQAPTIQEATRRTIEIAERVGMH